MSPMVSKRKETVVAETRPDSVNDMRLMLKLRYAGTVTHVIVDAMNDGEVHKLYYSLLNAGELEGIV